LYFVEFLTEKSELHLHFERIPLEAVPSEETKLQKWLYSRFQQKDRYYIECTSACFI